MNYIFDFILVIIYLVALVILNLAKYKILKSIDKLIFGKKIKI